MAQTEAMDGKARDGRSWRDYAMLGGLALGGVLTLLWSALLVTFVGSVVVSMVG